MTRMAVPVPSLVVLIGAAGAGKSTLAGRLFEPAEVLSSDDLRAMIAGDAADQRATRAAFAILHREAQARLAEGRLVVVDATNAEPAARSALLEIAGRAGVPAIVIALIGPPAEIHRRNAARIGRVVPAHVVDRHLARIARLGTEPAAIGAALRAEGFAAVHVLATSDDLARASIERQANRC